MAAKKTFPTRLQFQTDQELFTSEARSAPVPHAFRPYNNNDNDNNNGDLYRALTTISTTSFTRATYKLIINQKGHRYTSDKIRYNDNNVQIHALKQLLCHIVHT